MHIEKETLKNTVVNDLKLGVADYTYVDLYCPERLQALYLEFNRQVEIDDPDLLARFEHYRKDQGADTPAPIVSDLLIKMAAHLSAFIAKLFDITDQRQQQIQQIQSEIRLIFGFRDNIIKRALKKYKNTIKKEELALRTIAARAQHLFHFQIPGKQQKPDDPELMCCQFALWLDHLLHDITSSSVQIGKLRSWLAQAEDKKLFASALDTDSDTALVELLLDHLYQWIYAATLDTELAALVAGWSSFKAPAKVDFQDLVSHEEIQQNNDHARWATPLNKLRRRVGFGLTDQRYDQRQVQYEVDHCIFCHERGTDSCSKGMRNKKSNNYRENPLGTTLIGCPLEERISEMHVAKRQGDNIAALALIMIDNPMCPGTGHRICNDCMKACIYQKTEPVNIPQIETHVLTDVLFMRWGFEIYSLLTRWNPLNIHRPYTLPYNGKNILIVGLGPAGYTLSHYLLNEGFAVTGIDALKIEPLPESLIGKRGKPPAPIEYFRDHYEDLDKRILTGFGGVAEYGITARWDKNFLKVIYIALLRRYHFLCIGGIRFGGTITIEDAWELGFDHIAIATGAGNPTIIGLENNLIRGIRKASDFLMSLQLTGAAKMSSLANLQVHLPAGVIGGGLTAIDTATEIMAYYPVQVEKILHRYERLIEKYTAAYIRKQYDREELAILDQYIEHGKAIRQERKRATAANERPNFQPLLKKWGGVTLFYRKRIKDAPAYRQNHEEVEQALREGIWLAEGMSPATAIADEYGALQAVKFNRLHRSDTGQWIDNNEQITIPLKNLFIAAGTAPNTIYEQEHPYSFRMGEKFFQHYEPSWSDTGPPKLIPVDDVQLPKISRPAPLTSHCHNGKFISFYGDNHPVYAGNVVKAMASAKDGYPYITRLFAEQLAGLDPSDQPARDRQLDFFFSHLKEELTATIISINKLAANIVEIVVKAPMQARKFKPGQFYRVQNIEAYAPVYADTVLAAEGLALTGAWTDKEKGLISLITLEIGSSSRLCALWQPGDQLVVMGVTGRPTDITKDKTVMLVGGGLGNAVLFSVGKALRAANNKVIYFAGYKKPEDVFKVSEIEAAADVIVWAVDAADANKPIPTTRPQDRSYIGNIIDAIERYAKEKKGQKEIDLRDVQHMIVIGSDRMMAAVKEARRGRLKPYLQQGHTAIGSINSPMQCMMKGICAQCLCKHISPDTGEEYFVYSCYDQDQALDRVDFDHLNARLRQNSVQEKLSDLWLSYLLEQGKPDI